MGIAVTGAAFSHQFIPADSLLCSEIIATTSGLRPPADLGVVKAVLVVAAELGDDPGALPWLPLRLSSHRLGRERLVALGFQLVGELPAALLHHTPVHEHVHDGRLELSTPWPRRATRVPPTRRAAGQFPIEAAAAVLAGREGIGQERRTSPRGGRVDRQEPPAASRNLGGDSSAIPDARNRAGVRDARARRGGRARRCPEGLAQYCARETSLAAKGLVGAAQSEWLNRVRDDLENYRARCRGSSSKAVLLKRPTSRGR